MDPRQTCQVGIDKGFLIFRISGAKPEKLPVNSESLEFHRRLIAFRKGDFYKVGKRGKKAGIVQRKCVNGFDGLRFGAREVIKGPEGEEIIEGRPVFPAFLITVQDGLVARKRKILQGIRSRECQ